MYRKMEDFLKDWGYESSAMSKYLDNLTDESLNFKGYEGGRTLGFLAWHTVLSVTEMMNTAGIMIKGIAQDAEVPEKASIIRDVFNESAKLVTERVPQEWKDENLTDEITMYGEKWTKGYTLSVMVLHQAHHRGQMSMLMRMAGLKVPGVYGPAKEEWSAMGMEEMK